MLNLINRYSVKKNLSRKFGILSILAVAGYLFIPSTSYAKRGCIIVSGGHSTVNSHFDFKRDSTSLDGLPLYKGGKGMDYLCNGVNPPPDLTLNFEIKVNATPNHDGSYPTGISGLAIRYDIKVDSRNCSQDPNNPLKISCKSNLNKPTLFTPHISLQSQPDTPITGNVAVFHELTLYYNFGNELQKKLGTLLSTNLDFSFRRYGCTLNTSNINFNLGAQQQKDFTRIGSTGREDKQKITLTCDPNTKYSLQVDGTAESGHQGVIKLTSGSGAATGVGVQLLAGKSKDPIVFGQPKEMGTTASGTNLREEIDITARYYQTENKVTPGTANASATFTMTYQ